jgi:hypothetical protein
MAGTEVTGVVIAVAVVRAWESTNNEILSKI